MNCQNRKLITLYHKIVSIRVIDTGFDSSLVLQCSHAENGEIKTELQMFTHIKQ